MKRVLLVTALLLTTTLIASHQSDVKPNERTSPSEERSWTMTNSFGVGYRRDRQRLLEPTYIAYLDDCNSAYMQYQMEFAWQRLLLKLSADYSWLISGDLSFKGLEAPFQPPQQNFTAFHMNSGYIVDVQPAIGCRIQFWKFACNRGSFSFIPALGYTYTHFNAFPSGQQTSAPAGAAGFTTLAFTRPIQQDWYGPHAEGRIVFAWKERIRFDLFYQYTHLNFRQTFSQSVSNYYLDGAGEINTSTLRISSKGKTLRTQLGGADISYRSPHHWQIGSHFEGSATWSNTSRSILHVVRDFFIPDSAHTQSAYSEKLSAHWTRYLVNVYASYWF